MRLAAAALALALAGCASPPPPEDAPAPERYREAWTDFERETDALARAAGRNRLRVEGSAGRAREALGRMAGLLAEGPAARLGEISERLGALARTVAAEGALSGAHERALGSLRDEVARDFAPGKVELAARAPEPARPAEPGAFARWEAAHARFAESARGGDAARIVQDYSDVRAAMEAMASTEADRYRVERFLREYERLAERVAAGAAVEQDLKGIPVLEADIRAAFGADKK